MKLEVGMYVRTPKGIAKIKSMYAEPNQYIVYTDNKDIVFEYYLNNKNKWVSDYVKKFSNNIIDLIEAGDYVNGLVVTRICEDNETNEKFINLYGSISEWEEEDIKSIVTKEQFESMSYKVG